MKINNDFIKKIFNHELLLTKDDDRIKLSKYSELIPMYDIYTDSIYPIYNLKLHYRLKECHFRFITPEVIKWIQNKMSKTSDKEQIEKYSNNLKILSNYDIPTLEKTSYETLYKYSPDLGLSISICKRNSFHPYSQHLIPYYSRDELIKLGMNNKLIDNITSENLVDRDLHYKICKLVSKNDISFNEILKSLKHIIDNECINFTCFYSLTGSYIFNDYLRNNGNVSKYILDGLNSLSKCINSMVGFENDYFFYRFIENDGYLEKLKIGDTFIDKGFQSTTRDPFYSPGLSGDFGLILIKINIPKNKNGIGLFIENFSMFPKEEEYLISPSSKFKLISKDDKFKYYHTNKDFENKITKKYEFEYIDNDFKPKTRYNKDIPTIDLDTLDLMAKDRFTLFKLFLEKCDDIGQFEYNKYIFHAQFFDSLESYQNFYKNKTKNGFVIYYYHKGYPLFTAEFGDEYIINYSRTYYYYDKNQKLEEIEDFEKIISLLGRIFKYKKAKIYFPYYNFSEFEQNYNKEEDKILLYTYLYNKPLYLYLKSNIKYYNSKYFKFIYGYYNLDKLKNTLIDKKILEKLPPNLKVKYWDELIINIIENNYYLYPKLESWLNTNFNNLIENMFIDFDIIFYLKSKGIDIIDIPDIEHLSELDKGSRFNLIFNTNIRRY